MHNASFALEKALKVRLGSNSLFAALVANGVSGSCLFIADTANIMLLWFELLQLKGTAGSKRLHVHGCDLVRARKFYGYHSSEEVFVKIYLYPNDIPSFIVLDTCNILEVCLLNTLTKYSYYPHDVARAANLLLVCFLGTPTDILLCGSPSSFLKINK